MIAVLILSAASAAPAAASPAVQDWNAVDAMTQNIANALGRTAAPIDRRIKLAKCPEQPAITAMDSNSLAVRCTALGWRLRVTMMQASGMEAANSASQEFFTPQAAGRGRDAAGPPLVRRGDMVRISIDTPSYTVSYPATATQEGRLGESISLRGSDPKNLIVGVVTGPGRASIPR